MTDKLPIICLDFDGVVHSYTSGWKGATVCEDPLVPGFFEFISSLLGRARVAIYSSRSGEPGGVDAMRAAVERGLHAWGMYPGRTPDAVGEASEAVDRLEWPTTKPPALVTLDDRAICFDGRWPTADAVLGFKTWQKPTVTAHRVVHVRPDGTACTVDFAGSKEAAACYYSDVTSISIYKALLVLEESGAWRVRSSVSGS